MPIFDYHCPKCDAIKENVTVWDKHDLTESEKQNLQCCGETMESLFSPPTCIRDSQYLNTLQNILEKRSKQHDKTETNEYKAHVINKNFFEK